MWRQNNFKGNSDSDQSISDDEDFNLDLRDDRASFGGGEEKVREKEVSPGQVVGGKLMIRLWWHVKKEVLLLKMMLKCLIPQIRLTTMSPP
ncbi:hypothetical protein SLEP1_g17018 [Rubroshorea leprosula]|uniref:Uncharacterized protein n=1 Tax=Rubroshorea leprosula TaxID=152421 RepID=A0AAV5J1N8_9ROSI|nr:hypothetical protein SLEP1_g17018 [Rubroshorea leprosula]